MAIQNKLIPALQLALDEHAKLVETVKAALSDEQDLAAIIEVIEAGIYPAKQALVDVLAEKE